jgi:hypothetical protein
MSQTEYESVAEESLEELREEIPKTGVELTKMSVQTG